MFVAFWLYVAVTGGKPDPSSFSFTHVYDKALLVIAR